LASLAILASLRRDGAGIYYHADLAGRLGEPLFQRAVGRLHSEVLYEWLGTPFDGQRIAVAAHLRDIAGASADPPAVDSFARYLPKSAELPERQLFQADLTVILWLLETGEDLEAASGSTRSHLPAALTMMKASICHVKLTLREVAEALGVSPNYFGQVFRDHAGITFSRYLLAARMHAAARLLRSQGMPPKKVAITIGYSDTSNFFRDFRRVFRQGPTSYLLHSVDESEVSDIR